MTKHTTIKQRLMLLIVAPLISLLVFGGTLIATSYTAYRTAERTQSVLVLAVAAGKLGHALQIERGSTAGFLQSKGARFADVLPDVRARTDEQLAVFAHEAAQPALASLAALNAQLEPLRAELAGLAALRGRADKHEIGVPEQIASYTQAIADLLKLIGATSQFNSDARISQLLLSYLSFTEAKEQAGQERALTTAAFAADAIDPAAFRAILARHFRQDAYLDSFRATAGPGERSALEGVLGAAPAQAVDAMRQVLYERSATGGFGVDPQAWFRTITEKIDAMLGIEVEIARNIDRRAAAIVAEQRGWFYGSVVLTVLALGLMLGVAAWVSISVSRPLKEEVMVAEHAIRENDFSRSVPEAGPAEVVRAGRAFNDLMHEFREIIAEVKQSSQRITAAAHDLAASSKQVQESSSAQSDAAAAVAAAVEQASTSVSETAANALDATTVVKNARAETSAATAVMSEAVATMRSIAGLIARSSTNVTELSGSSAKIGGIVNVIREIAEQTNLLALNAAIEAARAGEQGRGFAVVADEVRKLAERTTLATAEIGSLVTLIQQGIGRAVTAMQQADTQAEQSLELVGNTEAALGRIGSGSERVAECVYAISGALGELDAAIREVAQNVERIAQMTDVNNRAAAANHATAQSLDSLSAALRESVTRYQT